MVLVLGASKGERYEDVLATVLLLIFFECHGSRDDGGFLKVRVVCCCFIFGFFLCMSTNVGVKQSFYGGKFK